MGIAKSLGAAEGAIQAEPGRGWLLVLAIRFPIDHKRDTSMSAVRFTCCSECGEKLHATFFCQECGQPSCSLDCYCRHEANHCEAQQTAQAEHQAQGPSTYLESAR